MFNDFGGRVLTLGIDIGSSTSKCAVMKNGSELLSEAMIPSGTGTSGPARALEAVFRGSGLTRTDICASAATGYGRNSVPDEAALTFSELTCHSKGAAFLCPGVRTVIDIGGQDSKVLSLSKDGRLVNFVMNDKCAAGTGRFLEVMARILELGLDEMGRLDALAEGRVDIASTCTVFAESEVISRLSQGVNISDLLAGIHRSVAVRAASLARRLGVVEPVFMTGGVSRNGGVLRALGEELGLEVITHEKAQLAGAIGAAICAYEHINNRLKGERQ
jgi:predicted CoA-substrate-specific enzyme activase